jgi:multidrug resistance efflux pump
VGLLLAWIFDSFFGNLVYFRAEGLVLRERVVLATQYSAAVSELQVREGWLVSKGEPLARLRSQNVEESLAKLHSQMAAAVTRATELYVREKVNEAVYPLAERRVSITRDARIHSEELLDRQLLAVNRHAELLNNELVSALSEAQLRAEHEAFAKELSHVKVAIESSRNAIDRLNDLYRDGVVNSPVDGIIGYLQASEGSIVKEAEPLIEIFTGRSFVLAYVPEGGLYDVQTGDLVQVRVGLSTYRGHVARTFELAGQLPKEFQQSFQPINRARLIRVEFEEGQKEPPLFAKTKLAAAGWPPDWIKRLVSTIFRPFWLTTPAATNPI